MKSKIIFHTEENLVIGKRSEAVTPIFNFKKRLKFIRCNIFKG